MLLTHAALPGMLARGRGHVVTISSITGKVALPYDPAYAVTKHAVAAFNRSLSAEYHAAPVTFSTVFPGAIRDAGIGTFLLAGLPAPAQRLMSRTPEQVGAAVVRALRDNRVEIVVSAQPVRQSLLVHALAPGLGVRSMQTMTRWVFSRGLRRIGRDDNPSEAPHAAVDHQVSR